MALSKMARATAGVLFKERHQLVAHQIADKAADFRIAELALRLALELCLLHLYADDAREALAYILAGKVFIGFL